MTLLSAANKTGGETPFLERPWVVAVLALFCCLLWGSAFPCIKIGYGLFAIDSADMASQMLFAGTRFTLSGVLVLLVQWLTTGRFPLPSRDDLKPIAVLALFQTFLQYLLFYLGLAHASGVSSSIAESSNTFLAIVFGALIFGQEKLTANKILGCIVGFAGVVVISLAGSGGVGFALAGEGAIVASAVSAALSTCFIRVFAEKHDPVLLSGWQFVVGGIMLMIVGATFGGRLTPEGPAAFALLGYLACLSAVAYTVWSLLLAHNDVARVAIFGFSNPIFGVILSALLLGETTAGNAVQVIIALVLVSAGILLVNMPQRKTAPM